MCTRLRLQQYHHSAHIIQNQWTQQRSTSNSHGLFFEVIVDCVPSLVYGSLEWHYATCQCEYNFLHVQIIFMYSPLINLAVQDVRLVPFSGSQPFANVGIVEVLFERGWTPVCYDMAMDPDYTDDENEVSTWDDNTETPVFCRQLGCIANSCELIMHEQTNCG